MKRYLSFILLLALMLGIFGVSHAATVQVGDGTATTTNFPIWGLWNYSYSQQIYTQAQINTSGSIEKIRFYYVSGPIANNKDWRIYMGHTDKTEFTSDSDWVPAAQLTQVFDGDVTTMLPLGNNWMEITLQNPFPYNNTDNLLIAVYQYTPNYATMTWGSFTSGPNTGIAFRDDNVNPDPNDPPTTCNTRGATINRIQFVFPDTDAPLAPELVFPENGAEMMAGQALSWTLPAGSADATGYDVYIDGGVVSNNQPGSSYILPADLALGTHSWYVVARNAVGDSPASETRTFEMISGVIIGNGTASYRDPFNVYYGYGRSLGLYTADQIGTNGVINTLGWSAASLGINPEVPYKIYLATTTETELTRMLWDSANPADDCFVSTATLVKEGTYTFDSIGWHEFTLDAPFVYTGGNLLVGVEANYGSNGVGWDNYPEFHYTTGTTGCHQSWERDNAPPSTNGTLNTRLPNLKMILSPLPTDPVFALNPTEWDFGMVLLNDTISKEFTIMNGGGGTLNVTGLSPVSDGPFSVTDAPAWPVALATGQTANFTIQYAPTAAGNHTATFTVAYDGGTADVTVSGQGFDPNITSFPYLQNFDGAWTGTPAAPLGWTVINANDDGYTWRQSNSYIQPTHSTPYAAHGMGNTDDWLITPAIVLGSEEVRMKWWDKVENATKINSYKVYVSTTTPEIASFTTELADINCANTAWTEHMLSLGAYAGQTIYVAFHQYASASTIYGFGIDDFLLEYVPTAAAAPILVSPADGAVNISKFGVDLIWEPDTSGLIPASYAVYLATDPGTIYDEHRWETTNTSFNPVTEGGMTFEYEQRWYWTVAAIDGTDEIPQETPRFFDVEADPTVSTYPWSENFDALNDYEIPLGWTFLYSNDGNDRRGWYILDHYRLEPHSEPNAAYVFYHANYPKDEWMITNPFSMQEGQAYNISFAVQGEGWDGVPESLKVYWGTEPTVASMTSNPAIFDNNGAAYAEWTMVNAMFIPPATGIYYFGWHACTQADVDYIAVDTITIDEAAAVDLAAMALGGDTYGYVNSPVEKTVSVTNMGSAEQSNYTVYLKEAVTNNVLAQELIAETLNAGETAVHTLSWTPAAAGVIDVYGEVELAGDANPANNVTDAVRVTIFSENVELLSIGATTGLAGINVAPFDAYYEGFVAETIYLASEIQVTSGEIEAVNYINYFVGGAWDFPTVRIWMQNTDVANVSTAWLPFENYVLVYDGPLHCPSGINDILISLDTPFNYTGGNLAIRTSKTYQTDWGGDRYWVATLDENYPSRTRYFRNTVEGAVVPENPTEGTPYNYIPNIVLAMNTTALVETLPAPAVNAAETTTGFELNWELIPYAYNYNVYVSADPYDYAAADTIVVYTNTYEMDTTADKNFYKVTAETYRDFTRAQVVLRNLEPRDIRIANEGMIAKPERKAQRMTINK